MHLKFRGNKDLGILKIKMIGKAMRVDMIM